MLTKFTQLFEKEVNKCVEYVLKTPRFMGTYITKMNMVLTIGWKCTREVGHSGPCAAVPLTTEIK